MDFATKVGCSLLVILLVIHVILGFNGFLPNYSKGSRIGVVDKISNKGLINKSHEGEMKMIGMSANSQGQLVQNVFSFSVRDSVIAKQIEDAAAKNKPIKVYYTEYKVKPSFYQDTEYNIVKVEDVE
jgi:hypothetical protein